MHLNYKQIYFTSLYMQTYHREVDPKVKVVTANIVYLTYMYYSVHLIVLVSAVK